MISSLLVLLLLRMRCSGGFGDVIDSDRPHHRPARPAFDEMASVKRQQRPSFRTERRHALPDCVDARLNERHIANNR